MSGENGSHVTWRELNLLRETMDGRFDGLEKAVLRIEVKLEAKTAFWANAWVLLLTSGLGAAVGTGIWFIFG